MDKEIVCRPCDACGKHNMRPAIPESRWGDSATRQLDNALEINFGGGYGMFIDPLDENYSIIICHDCAHELCSTVPWIDKLLKPRFSHSHVPYSVPLDHVGWDNEKVPLFVHDCDGCTFLGGYTSNEARQYGSVLWDLYVCDNASEPSLSSFIARFGDDGAEYLSSPLVIVGEASYAEERPDHPLVEAHRRWATQESPT